MASPQYGKGIVLSSSSISYMNIHISNGSQSMGVIIRAVCQTLYAGLIFKMASQPLSRLLTFSCPWSCRINLLLVNHIPRRGNWPENAVGYFCGTIPYNDAPCLTTALNNVDQYGPATFSSCCDGPVVNITQAITDVNDPSYGATCLAYCPVNVSRSMDLSGGVVGEYFKCIENQATESPSTGGKDRNGDDIYGSVTCGWTGVSEHDKCESSISILKTNTASQQAWYPFSQLDISHPTTILVTTTTYSTCPPQTTASATRSSSSSSPTTTGRNSSASGVRPTNAKAWISLSLMVVLLTQISLNQPYLHVRKSESLYPMLEKWASIQSCHYVDSGGPVDISRCETVIRTIGAGVEI